MKENIKLKDFLVEASKCLKNFAEAIKPEIETLMQCPKCGTSKNNSEEYCSKDGSKLEEIKYEVHSEEAEHEIRRFFFDFNELEIDDSFPYEFIETFESSDDDHGGDKYFINFIFKRKSDDKYFEFTMSSWGELEGSDLHEVSKKTKTIITWE